MEASSSLLHDTTTKVADLSARTRALRSLLEENHSRTNELDQMLQNGYRTVESTVVGTKQDLQLKSILRLIYLSVHHDTLVQKVKKKRKRISVRSFR